MAKKSSYQQLNPEGLAKTGSILGFIFWIAGLFFHGMIGIPSFAIMFGLPYMHPTVIVGGLIVLVIAGLIVGWLTATIYNWTIKK